MCSCLNIFDHRFNTKCSPRQMGKVFDKILKSEKHVRIVEEMGFGHLLRLKCRFLSKELVEWLVDRIDPQDMTISLGSGRLELTADDVRLILGIPNDSISIGGSTYTELREAFMADWPGCWSNNQDGPYLTQLDDALEKDVEAGDRFKRNFLVSIVSRLLAPASRVQSSWRFLRFVHDLNDVADMNFCEYILNKLAKAIFKWKGEVKPQMLSGCLLFLQVSMLCVKLLYFCIEVDIICIQLLTCIMLTCRCFTSTDSYH